MNKKDLHVIAISGGKDSAALAIYLKEKYPEREFMYLFFDTGEEDAVGRLQSQVEGADQRPGFFPSCRHQLF